jgi:hypothetical protein
MMDTPKFNVGDIVWVPGRNNRGAVDRLCGKITLIFNEGRFIQVQIAQRKPIFYCADDVRPFYEV